MAEENESASFILKDLLAGHERVPLLEPGHGPFHQLIVFYERGKGRRLVFHIISAVIPQFVFINNL